MKLLISTLLLSILWISTSYAQKKADSEVPESVKKAFNSKFPSVKKARWEKESENEWEAEFKLKGVEYSSKYSETGEWLETEHEIKLSEIPQNIKALLDQNLKEYSIEEAEIEETADGISYEFEIKQGNKEFEVLIDSKNQFSKKEEDEKEDENKK